MKRLVLFILVTTSCSMHARIGIGRKVFSLTCALGAASFTNDVYQTWDNEKKLEDYQSVHEMNLGLALKRWINLQTPKEFLRVVTLDLVEQTARFTAKSAKKYWDSMNLIIENARENARRREELEKELAGKSDSFEKDFVKADFTLTEERLNGGEFQLRDNKNG